MFHRSCIELRTSLLARIQDLETANASLVEKLGEEREAASARERELVDRLLALTNPLAARAVAMTRSASPAATPPVVGRGRRSEARVGARPLLDPTTSGFRPLSDFMERQRAESVRRATAADSGRTAAPPASQPEPEPEPGLPDVVVDEDEASDAAG